MFAVGLAGVLLGRLRTVAACALGLMAVASLLLTSRIPWLGMAVLGVMFAGTAIHRWERGTGGLWPVAVTAALVAIAPAPLWAVEGGWWWAQADVWITTMVLAGATFAGGMRARAAAAPAAGVVRADQLLALPGAPPAAEVFRAARRRPAVGRPAVPARHGGAGRGPGRGRERAHLPLRRTAHAGAGPPGLTPMP
ncbi:hypothetical protein ACFQYP_27680 [Nonomuraea antimicrobica]